MNNLKDPCPRCGSKSGYNKEESFTNVVLTPNVETTDCYINCKNCGHTVATQNKLSKEMTLLPRYENKTGHEVNEKQNNRLINN